MNTQITTEDQKTKYAKSDYLFNLLKISNKFFRKGNTGLTIKNFSPENYENIIDIARLAHRGRTHIVYIVLEMGNKNYILFGGESHHNLLSVHSLSKYQEMGCAIKFLGAGELKLHNKKFIANDRSGTFVDYIKIFSEEEKSILRKLMHNIAPDFYEYSESKQPSDRLDFSKSNEDLDRILSLHQDQSLKFSSDDTQTFYTNSSNSSNEDLAQQHVPFSRKISKKNQDPDSVRTISPSYEIFDRSYQGGKTEKLYSHHEVSEGSENSVRNRFTPEKKPQRSIIVENQSRSSSWQDFVMDCCFGCFAKSKNKIHVEPVQRI